MAQADDVIVSSSHVSIRIDDDDDYECAVCMEPLELVAIGACGHRALCVRCAVRMRFFQDDRRCCICRALCATVVVTRASASAAAAAASSNDGQGQRPFFGPGVRPRWYHGGMAAYFDDRVVYDEVSKMCRSNSKPLCPAEREDQVVVVVVDSFRAPPQGQGRRHGPIPVPVPVDGRTLLTYLALMTLAGAAFGITIAMYLEHWLARVAVVLASALLVLAFAYFHDRRLSREVA